MEKETVDRSLMYEYDNTSYYQKRSERKEEYYIVKKENKHGRI